MRSKFVALALALIVALPASATGARDYVFVIKRGSSEKALRTQLRGTQIARVRSLGNSTFQVFFEIDPGLKALQARARKSKKLIESVQENMRYQALPETPAKKKADFPNGKASFLNQ